MREHARPLSRHAQQTVHAKPSPVENRHRAAMQAVQASRAALQRMKVSAVEKAENMSSCLHRQVVGSKCGQKAPGQAACVARQFCPKRLHKEVEPPLHRARHGEGQKRARAQWLAAAVRHRPFVVHYRHADTPPAGARHSRKRTPRRGREVPCWRAVWQPGVACRAAMPARVQAQRRDAASACLIKMPALLHTFGATRAPGVRRRATRAGGIQSALAACAKQR
jgi:hypothetical protein